MNCYYCTYSCVHIFSDVLITTIDADISYEGLLSEMKAMCKFEDSQPFTIKWVDEEGWPFSLVNYFENTSPVFAEFFFIA